MALFKSALVTQLSGSIGGMTAAHNSSGMYLRARTIPVNPNSNRQQAMRMYMDSAVTFWTQTLTEAQRESWRTYAQNVTLMNPLGDPINVSGQNMFVRSGVAMLLVGNPLDQIEEAPTIFNTGDPGTLSIDTADSALNTVTINIDGAPAWAAIDEASILGFMAPPQNPSVNFLKGPFRFVNDVRGNSVTPLTSADFDTTDADPPIPFIEGQRVFFRVRVLYDDGRLTQAFIFHVEAADV